MHWLELALLESQDRRIHPKEEGTMLIDSDSTHNFIRCKLAKNS